MRSCVASYRQELRRRAALFSRSFVRLDVRCAAARTAARCRQRWRARPSGANRTSDRALRGLSRRGGRASENRQEPPLIARPLEREAECSPRRSTTTYTPPPGGRRVLGGTPWSTSRTKWSEWEVSGYALTWRSDPRGTTSCSCNSNGPTGRYWRATCTASRRGARTRASGWWSTSRRCRNREQPL